MRPFFFPVMDEILEVVSFHPHERIQRTVSMPQIWENILEVVKVTLQERVSDGKVFPS